MKRLLTETEAAKENIMDIDSFIRTLIEETVAKQLSTRPTEKAVLDEQSQEAIRQLEIVSRKPYLTKQDLAVYFDCSVRAIEDWAARGPQQNPLPMVRVGRDFRIRRERADEWAEREGQRFRLKQVS